MKKLVLIPVLFSLVSCKTRRDASNVSEIGKNRSADRSVSVEVKKAIKESGIREAIVVGGSYVSNIDERSEFIGLKLITVTNDGDILDGVDNLLLRKTLEANKERMVKEKWPLKDIFRFQGNDNPELSEVIAYLKDSEANVFNVEYNDYHQEGQIIKDKLGNFDQDLIKEASDFRTRSAANTLNMEKLATMMSKILRPAFSIEKTRMNYAQRRVTTYQEERELLNRILLNKPIEIKPLEILNLNK